MQEHRDMSDEGTTLTDIFSELDENKDGELKYAHSIQLA
jgi:hypothetical protein